MIVKSLSLAARVVFTAHKLVSSVSAVIFISHGVYQFLRTPSSAHGTSRSVTKKTSTVKSKPRKVVKPRRAS